jgi:hypothetical protein
LQIGAKANVNALATAPWRIVTLGFGGNLEPWAVTDEDRRSGYNLSFGLQEFGYETLLTAGLGRLATAPGRISSAVRLYYTVDSGVQVGRGINDIANNGLTWQNGLQTGLAVFGLVGSVRRIGGPPQALGVHGNSYASTRITTLYQLVDRTTNALVKWGISGNIAKRYTETFLSSIHARLVPILTGSRRRMAQIERSATSQLPGPLNLERWAGSMNPR